MKALIVRAFGNVTEDREEHFREYMEDQRRHGLIEYILTIVGDEVVLSVHLSDNYDERGIESAFRTHFNIRGYTILGIPAPRKNPRYNL